MNIIDKTISIFSPRTAYQRQTYRRAMRIADDRKRSYDAGSHDKRNQGWRATGASANTEIAGAQSTIRARARELARNNSYAKKANRVIVNNTIGTGIKPSPITDITAVSEKIKKAWNDWAESTQIDFYGKKNFYGIQRLVMRTVAMSGEALVLRVVKNDKKSVIPVKLKVLEGDYIDSSKDGQMNGKNEIRQGIEVDPDDNIVAYWLFTQHPGDNRIRFNLNSTRVPADQIVAHVFEEERPGQLRGVPFGVSSMVRLRDLDGYEDAQLIRQKIAACFTAFVSNSGEGLGAGEESSDPDQLDRIEPGRIEYLAPGEEVTFGNPPEVSNYEQYTKQVLRGIAAGFGISYEAISGDLSGVNFSSGRMGWLEMQRQLTDWQRDLIIPQLCEPIWDEFMRFMLIKGQLSESVKANWTPPRREMIDPSKEVGAIKEMIRNGLGSLPDYIQQLGGDPDVVIAEIKKFNEKLDEAGVILDSDPRKDIKRINNNSQNLDANE